MRPTLVNTLLTALTVVTLGACTKDAPPAAKATAGAEAPAKPAAPPAFAAEAPAKPVASSIGTDTKVTSPAAAGEGANDETKAKLAKVYTEIYCAQRRGESEKLLEIYVKHGFDDPETWTKTWTKAAQDGAWVAKTTHDAIRACEKEGPATP
jgi:hypothetical protein